MLGTEVGDAEGLGREDFQADSDFGAEHNLVGGGTGPAG
jgi:hypothetical protein